MKIEDIINFMANYKVTACLKDALTAKISGNPFTFKTEK